MGVIIFILGMIFGSFCTCGLLVGHYNNSKVGKLRLDRSTGDAFLFLELEVPVEYALSQKEVLLEVDLNDITRQ